LYGTAGELLDHPGLDAVFIVSPEQMHAEHALAAIDRELPIFMEKPLSTTIEEARTVTERAKQSGTYVQIGFVLRFDAQHAILKQQIDGPGFGQIVSAHFKRNCSRSWFPAFGDRAHTVYETIIHDIDLLVWFTGSRCESVYAVQRFVSGHRYPDALMATLQFANGTIAQIETAWLVPDFAPRNVVAGDWIGTIDAEFEMNGLNASARYRLLDSGLSIASSESLHSPEVGLWPDVYGAIGGALRTEDEHFIQCVRAGTTSTIASLDQALHGLEIAEAMIRSAESGTTVTL
jgi:predicted dehydrogenase